ncbi:MAG: DNA primase [Nitrosopumilus sp.]|nr:DNA primase [Nitrosopumilus sp.]MDA7958027.1 DNA primase [Nitrosopumilus sp.]MDA7959432.1 DNA primase [Nitrosopumilus sp.]
MLEVGEDEPAAPRRKKLEVGEDELARYPFLDEAGDYMKDTGFSLEDLAADPAFGRVRDMALARIEAAAEGRVFMKGAPDELPVEIYSFLLAVVMLKISSRRAMYGRFALAEARRAERFLESDLRRDTRASMGDATRGVVARIMHDLFEVDIERDGDDITMPVPSYLLHSTGFHEREWKLVNRRVSGGMVRLTPREAVRLLRSAVASYISSRITSARTPPSVPGLEKYVSRITELAAAFEPAASYTGEYPPCIKHAIGVLEKGENLPHSGRFMLGTYLLNAGKSIEEIAPLFKGAPDYNEKTTLYQLRSLKEGAGGSGYSCPSCDKLRTQDLCHETAECAGISHPGQFGRGR